MSECVSWIQYTGNVHLYILSCFQDFQGNSQLRVEPQVTPPRSILKLQMLTQLRVVGGRQGKRHYWKGIVNLVNVKYHTKTTEHADKVEEDTSRPHARHPHNEKLWSKTNLLFFVFLFHVWLMVSMFLLNRRKLSDEGLINSCCLHREQTNTFLKFNKSNLISQISLIQ